MRVDLTEPQIRMLISAASLMNAEMDDSIEDGFYTERDRAVLDRAFDRLWESIGNRGRLSDNASDGSDRCRLT